MHRFQMSLESRAAWFVNERRPMRLLCFIAVSVVTSTASADVAVMVGTGLSRLDDANNETPLMPAIDVLVGARLDAHWSIGGRLQAAWPLHRTTILSVGPGGDFEHEDDTIQAVDLGVSARYEDHGWWLAPWIGEHVAFATTRDYGQAAGNLIDGTSTDNVYAFELGLTAGVDVYTSGSDKLSIYADYHHVVHDDSSLPPVSERTASQSVADWSALTVGLAYRR